MTKNILTQQYLKECLHYEPETGVFTWKVRPITHFVNEHRMNLINSKCATKEAGMTTDQGYQLIGVASRSYKAHRLAFLYMLGRFPLQTDHINHNRLDNRWRNLREVTAAANNRNLSTRKSNTTGVPGVAWHKKTAKWRARILKEHIGLFTKLEDAIAARKKWEKIYMFHENHGANCA